MDKKILFFDIDGTLLTDDKKLLDSTKEAIRILKEKGHEVGIATGRNALMAKELIDELEMDNYVVCNGAAAVYHRELVYSNPLHQEEMERLLQVADSHDHPIIYETAFDLKRRHEEVHEKMEISMKAVGYPVPEYDYSFYENNDLIQLLLFYNEEDRSLYEDGQFPNLRFVRWHESGVDVLPKDGSKAETILKIAQEQGYDIEDIIVFGDGLNDYEMISKAGLGVAMGNALDVVKEQADLITKSNNEDGIYLALQELNML